MKQRIFIGSSSESLLIAHAIEETLAKVHEPTVWDEGIFGLTESTLAGLIDRLDKSDAAVFVLSPDDITRMRGSETASIRDNVIFELGLFIGRLGPKRTFFVIPRGRSDLRLPSDLLGITAATYDASRSDGNWTAALRPPCSQIERELSTVAKQEQHRVAEQPTLLSEGLVWMHDYVNRALKRHVTESALPSFEDCGIESSADGLSTKIGRIAVHVRFGRIEKSDATQPGRAIALPATEFFDDECIADPRSALGAYFNAAFPGRLAEMQEIVLQELKNEKSELVEREPNRRHLSYGVGKCVYLKNPLASGRRIILVAVTTKRAGIGIRCEPFYLFAAMRALCQTMNDNRLSDLELPVMGSGHGGLESELALL